jgi:NADP-dependent 3-hydroxy acid dehydrogenase YdfG
MSNERKPLVVITGATAGIGLKAALKFSEAGYPLLLMGRNIQPLIALNLPNAMVSQVDVTDIDSFKLAIEKAEKTYGPADAILNIAGMMLLGDIADQHPEEWQRMLNVNVMGVLNGMQAVLPGMKQRCHGTIMNVSSIAGIKPFPNHAAYVGTKFAVHGLTDNVREEMAPYNVRVITIAPGAVNY